MLKREIISDESENCISERRTKRYIWNSLMALEPMGRTVEFINLSIRNMVSSESPK